MAYNPELVKQLLGEEVAKLMDGSVEIIKSQNEFMHGLRVGDTLVFNLKPNPNFVPREFVITKGK